MTDQITRETLKKGLTELLDKIWSSGDTPKIFIDARHRDVVVPEHVRTQWGPRLVIDLVASYPLNLSYDNDALRVDLAFAGSTMRCAFPWNRIYVVSSRDTRTGVVIKVNLPEANPPAEVETATAEARKGAFRVIKGGRPN